MLKYTFGPHAEQEQEKTQQRVFAFYLYPACSNQNSEWHRFQTAYQSVHEIRRLL